MDKIFIIDDDKVNLLLAKKFLSAEYEVETFSSPVEALENVAMAKPALILLDIEMPEMNGFEVIAKLRSEPEIESIPVIFLTADRSEKTEAECFKAGAVDYLSKPFIADIMLQRVKRCLKAKTLKQKIDAIKAKLSEYEEKLPQEFVSELSEILK